MADAAGSSERHEWVELLIIPLETADTLQIPSEDFSVLKQYLSEWEVFEETQWAAGDTGSFLRPMNWRQWTD